MPEIKGIPTSDDGIQCCHLTMTAGTNWNYCELVENKQHTWRESCKKLRETGRCKHPGVVC
jgi:hypothetical protein